MKRADQNEWQNVSLGEDPQKISEFVVAEFTYPGVPAGNVEFHVRLIDFENESWNNAKFQVRIVNLTP
jgi:hypothetical protein